MFYRFTDKANTACNVTNGQIGNSHQHGKQVLESCSADFEMREIEDQWVAMPGPKKVESTARRHPSHRDL